MGKKKKSSQKMLITKLHPCTAVVFGHCRDLPEGVNTRRGMEKQKHFHQYIHIYSLYTSMGPHPYETESPLLTTKIPPHPGEHALLSPLTHIRTHTASEDANQRRESLE